MTDNQWSLEKVFEVSRQYWQACVLHAAVQLDIFDVIAEKELTAAETACEIGGDLRGLSILLDALCAMGLMEKDAQRYRNTEIGRNFLMQTSPRYQGHIIKHMANLVAPWANLSQAVMQGKPVRIARDIPDDQVRENFLLGMFNLAMGIAPHLSQDIDLRGRTHLLDLGGGPGTYAIHFCLANPRLRATVFDLPTTKPFAQRTIERFAVAERVTFHGGDYLRTDIPGTYDVVWMSHILHALGPQECEMVITKAVKTLTPGGIVLIQDFILDDTGTRPLFPALFAVNMLVNTHNGRAYREGEIRAMLQKVDVREIVRLPYQGPNNTGILQGKVSL